MEGSAAGKPCVKVRWCWVWASGVSEFRRGSQHSHLMWSWRIQCGSQAFHLTRVLLNFNTKLFRRFCHACNVARLTVGLFSVDSFPSNTRAVICNCNFRRFCRTRWITHQCKRGTIITLNTLHISPARQYLGKKNKRSILAYLECPQIFPTDHR